MAALTSTGPWPLSPAPVTDLVVYRPPAVRQAIAMSDLAVRLLTGGASGAAGSTTVPAVPVSTRFPVSP